MDHNSTVQAACTRPVTATDFSLLSELAFRSKAHWGYDAAFMTTCRDDLAITPEQAADQLMYVLERDGMLIGFYGLRIGGDEAELTNLFVEPTTIGFGYGKQLWQHAIAIAQAYRIERIVIESDPHAEMFYRAMGAVRVGDVPSSVIPGRVLPLLKFVIGDTSR